MKLKLMLVVTAFAGLAAALALAAPTQAGDGTTTNATTSTSSGEHHGKKDDDKDKHGDKGNRACQKVELKGSNGAGSVALTVARASHGGSSLVGKQVTLTIPAGASLSAKACMDASGALTLRVLKVDEHNEATTTTATTTTTTTTTTGTTTTTSH